MLRMLSTLATNRCLSSTLKLARRTFLSPAYYCNEVWEDRLNDEFFRKINLDEFYHALDQKFQKSREISAIDVDVFVNAANEEIFADELLDLVHKLRLTAQTTDTFESTHHAVVRYLMKFNLMERLLDVLDDRINYGIFLDFYTANLLMDVFWKGKRYVDGARVASQMMLQEEVDHPLFKHLGLLHCYKFVLDPVGWPEPVKVEEPEEEVKIRVKYLRNPYFDDHFDLRDPLKIVGKTLAFICKGENEAVYRSFYILGLVLYDKNERAEEFVDEMIKNNETCVSEILQLIPQDKDIHKKIEKLKKESVDVEKFLTEKIKTLERSTTEKEIAERCKLFNDWSKIRKTSLEEQKARLLREKKLADAEKALKELKEKESKLWFFENEEQIELAIEEAELALAEKGPEKKKKKKDEIGEEYIPPEIRKQHSIVKDELK